MITFAKTKKATISARIIRADGRVEDLGVIWRTKGRLKNIIDKIKLWLQYLQQ